MDAQMSKDLNAVFNIITSPVIAKYSGAVMCYVCLFEVTPFQLKAPKFRRIIEEMKKLFDAESFSFQKKTYSISHAGIVEALDVCIKKHFEQTLENHNYLKKVMIGISEREGKGKSKQAEKDLRKREGNALAGNGRPEKEETPRSIPPEVAEANMQRCRDIVSGIGKKI